MKAIFYCFSGTGNTLRVMNRIKDEWEKRGHDAKLVTIRPDTEPEAEEYDRIVVGFPVHAFNAPAPVLNFLKRFPKRAKGGEQTVFLLRTSGEPVRMNDTASVLPSRILKRRGYAVKGDIYHVMPYNIIFRHSDEMAARMDRASKIKAPHDAFDLERGEGKRYRTNMFMRIASFFLRIEHPAMPVVGLGFHAKKDKCVGCGKCARTCPQGNITMKDGKPKFGGHCVACMGCAFSCPTDAVRPSLLNGWRVNGAYPYGGLVATDEQICRYCRKAYLRYFHEAEEIARQDYGVVGAVYEQSNSSDDALGQKTVG